jgi:hypothetical protein
LLQPNVVKSKIIKSYTKWCVFGKKSKNPKNVKSDFEEFKNDKVMTEVIRRLEKDELEPFEFDYALHYALHEHSWKQDRKELEQEMAKAREQAAKERQIMLSNAVHGFLALGKDIPYIAGILGISVEEATHFAQQKPPQ